MSGVKYGSPGRLRRYAGAAGFVVALTMLGGSASALAFGPTTVYDDGRSRGAGKGNFYPIGFDGLRLESTLKDYVVDGDRTYAEGQAVDGMRMFGKVQSGRRSDGGSSWANMVTVTTYVGVSNSPAYATTKVCLDQSFQPDPCAGSASGSW